MTIDPILTPEQLAAELQIKVQTLAKWRLTGEGPCFLRIGRKIRYSRTSVSDWLITRERTSTSDTRNRHA